MQLSKKIPTLALFCFMGCAKAQVDDTFEQDAGAPDKDGFSGADTTRRGDGK
jgi:hypothetical protein